MKFVYEKYTLLFILGVDREIHVALQVYLGLRRFELSRSRNTSFVKKYVWKKKKV